MDLQAWLDPLDLPQEEQLLCRTSSCLLEFLMQIYAPLDDVADAFHRMIYVFASPQVHETTLDLTPQSSVEGMGYCSVLSQVLKPSPSSIISLVEELNVQLFKTWGYTEQV